MFKRNFLKSKALFFTIVLMYLCASGFAQDLIIENTNISTSENYTSQTITIGPNVSIDGTGDAVLSANSIAVKAPFYILSGGELTVITGSAPVSVDPEAINVLPENFIVRQNYPNPFNPITHISYDLPKTMNVEIVIYNVSGQLVNRLLSTEQPAGSYTVTWDGTDNTGALVSSAIYYYRIKAGKNIISRKMTFIK